MDISVLCIIILIVLWLRYQIIIADKEAKNRTICRANDKARVQEILAKRVLEYRQGNTSSPIRRGTEPLEKKVIPIVKKQPSPVATVSAEIHNIAPDVTDTSWFLCTHKDLPAPSAAESLIIEQLDAYNIKWYREVSFKGLQFTAYSFPRYDFYIPSLKLVLEYDGIHAHTNELQIATDKAKDKFCHDNGITIHRQNRLHYYKMGPAIKAILKEYNVQIK